MEVYLLIVLLILLIGFGRGFVRQGLQALLAVAVLIAMASIGRALFASIPNVQPASFLIMVCGFIWGPGAGLVAGILTALLSSLLTSLGLHTVWQAFFWGLMGLSAAAFRRTPIYVRVSFGFIWGFLFGWGMNLWYYSLAGAPFSWSAYLVACTFGFNFDLLHAAANAALLFLYCVSMEKKIEKLGIVKIEKIG